MSRPCASRRARPRNNPCEQGLAAALDPAAIGLVFQPLRERALAASSQAEDFGGLFLGFSFFLIAAALILLALLFQFGLEKRATEIGTLLAVGWPPRLVRRLFLLEGTAIAVLGGLLGAAGGVSLRERDFVGAGHAVAVGGGRFAVALPRHRREPGRRRGCRGYCQYYCHPPCLARPGRAARPRTAGTGP